LSHDHTPFFHQRFFSRIESGEILACTSVLSFDELAYCLILALIKDKYGGSPLEHLRAGETDMLKEFAPAVIPRLQSLQAFPNLAVTEIIPRDINAMYRNMIDYPLRQFPRISLPEHPQLVGAASSRDMGGMQQFPKASIYGNLL